MSRAHPDEPPNLAHISTQTANSSNNSLKFKAPSASAINSSAKNKKKSLRHKKWRMYNHSHSERLAQRLHGGLLQQIDSEIATLGNLLKKVQDRKSQLQHFICRFTCSTKQNPVSKPRNWLVTKFPQASAELSMSPECPLPSNILASSGNICPNRSCILRPIQPAQLKTSIYDAELNLLLSTVSRNREVSAEEKRRIISYLIRRDFTGYGKTMYGFVLHMKFCYDFIPSNPLLLLSSRWAFIPKIERIVRCVLRKRKGHQKDSEYRYSDYRAKYARWKLKKVEPECSGAGRAGVQKKIDIYGRESPLILPKSGAVPELGFYLDGPFAQYQLRKESLDLDPDLYQHSIPYVNCYSEPTVFRVKPRLVTEPFEHYAEYEKNLWSRCEMQIFLEQFFLSYKDFQEISSRLPHKEMPQLMQFYYDFKEPFGLKKYSQCLNARRRDKRINIQTIAREFAKTLLLEKIFKHLEPKMKDKSLFTIEELKAICGKQKNRPTDTVEKEVQPLEVNTEFFKVVYRSSVEKIQEMFRECALRGNGFEPGLTSQREYATVKMQQQYWTRSSLDKGKGTKGAHWSEKEKELFVNCLATFGKSWEAIAPKFPNKTIKQLRNFFQNNKDKLCLNGYVKHKS